MILMDGPMGTQLNHRGVTTSLPLWSATAIEDAPEVLSQIHSEYSAAGATVHTTNTFRTKARNVGPRWRRWTAQAIQITHQAIPSDALVAGSLSPLEDCYRPDLSPVEHDPKGCQREHLDMAQELAAGGCDLILCETFPNTDEVIVAVTAAVSTGLPVWLAMTAGPNADLLTPLQLVEGARRTIDVGAAAVLVNCTPATKTLPFVAALGDAKLSVPIGAYANAGHIDEKIGWRSPEQPGVQEAVRAYVHATESWADAGATILGGCCGTGPEHIAGLYDRWFGNLSDSQS